MKTLKHLFQEYEPFIKGVITSLIIIAIYDLLIAPGLTAKNTVINILSFLGGSILILITGLLIWENLFKTNKKEEKWQETPTETLEQGKENSKNKENENNNN